MSKPIPNTNSIDLSIIIPTYNDADALTQLLPQLYTLLNKQLILSENPTIELLLIDDGSEDDIQATYYQQLKQLPQHIQLRLIQFTRNFGKEAALSAGLAYSQGKLVAIMDADGQHPLDVFTQMLQLIQTQPNIDMVAAIQATRPHESYLSKLLKKGFYHFIQDSHRYTIRPNAGDFRVMNQKVVQALLSLPERQRFMKGLYAWVGFRTLYLPFTPSPRQEGKSKFNYQSLFELAMIGITSFSQKPLRWISRMGLLVSILSILYGLFIVAETLLFGNNVPGWATVAAGIMFSAGVQLICLGVIGEYIGRLYEEIKQRPLYLVNQVLDSTQTQHNTQNHT